MWQHLESILKPKYIRIVKMFLIYTLLFIIIVFIGNYAVTP